MVIRCVLLSTVLVLATSCARHQPHPVHQWWSGEHELALERQAALAETPSRQQTLEQLRLGSMALALGDLHQAEQAFRSAAGAMTDFRADGEFAALVGAESAKEWKGEPYEKMAAMVTLGALLYGEEDRGNALAMFKSAILADTGTRLEHYRSDFVTAWVLQALAYQAEGESDNARRSMEQAIDGVWSRHTIDVLSRSLWEVDVDANPWDVEAARVVLSTSLSAGATAAPRDPMEAARATVSHASTLVLQQKELPRRQRFGDLATLGREEIERAVEVLPQLQEAWIRSLEQDQPSWHRGEQFTDRAHQLLEHPPRVVLLVERGQGPRKVASGRYGEILQIVPRREGTQPRLSVDGQITRPLKLD
ncbi:MAG: hypothetical protein QGG40_05120, partial [Myxococcota bacterium]|nr:hypothetical protein [Myxococcota bacterium]